MNRTLLVRCICVLSAGFALAGCSELFGPAYASHFASVDTTFSPIVTMPDSAAADSSFVVSFKTGGGGCDKVGNTTVTMVGTATAVIRAYDQTQTNASACNAIAYLFAHSAPVRFARIGMDTVRVLSASGDTGIAYTRTVVVH